MPTPHSGGILTSIKYFHDKATFVGAKDYHD